MKKVVWFIGVIAVVILAGWIWVAQASASRAMSSFESYASELNLAYSDAYANYDKEGDGKTTVSYVVAGEERMVSCTCDVKSYFLLWQRSCEKYDAIKMNANTNTLPRK